MSAMFWVSIALQLVTTLIREGYKISEELELGSATKSLLDAALDSLDVVRGTTNLFQVVMGGGSEDEIAAAKSFHAEAKERQRLRLLELGIEV